MFYKKIAHKIYKEDHWYSFTDEQIDEMISLHKNIMNNVGYLSFSTITFLTSNGIIFTNEESYLKHIKENFKPDPATIREKQLKIRNMNDYKTPKEFIQNQIKIGKQTLFGWFENIEEFEVVNTTIIYNKDDKENDIIRIECEYQDEDLNYNEIKNSIGTSKKTFKKRLEYYKTYYDEFITNNRDEKITKLLGED